MVKIGFICEGDTERQVIGSESFNHLLSTLGIHLVAEPIDAKGNGNLLPENIRDFRDSLLKNGAKKLFILTDLDIDSCITSTITRIKTFQEDQIVISVKQIEAWFLADSDTLSLLLGKPFQFTSPEAEIDPFETLRTIFLAETSRGVGTKSILARRMIKYGFTIEQAAAHPNCPSARHFLQKLTELQSNPA